MSSEPLGERLAQAQAPANPLASPEFATLRTLRRELSRGGLPVERTPVDDARIATCAVVSDLLRVLDDFRKRVQRGDRVRLLVREQRSAPGQMKAELVIEPVASRKDP